MLKENITTFAYISYYIDILYSLFISGLLLSLFVCLLTISKAIFSFLLMVYIHDQRKLGEH